jgi:hypothetical protein
VLALGTLISLAYREKRQQATLRDAPLTSTPTTTISTPAGRAFLLPSSSSTQRLLHATIFPDSEIVHHTSVRMRFMRTPIAHRCIGTTAEPSCARCKQSARSATRMTIGRHCMRRPPHDLLSWTCRFHFRSSSIAEVRRTSQNFAFVPRAVMSGLGNGSCLCSPRRVRAQSHGRRALPPVSWSMRVGGSSARRYRCRARERGVRRRPRSHHACVRRSNSK